MASKVGPVAPGGFVTFSGSGKEWATANSISRLGDRSLPVRQRFGSELPQGRSGDEMLQVEGVVDGGMDAEKPLCGAGRLEPPPLLSPVSLLSRGYAVILTRPFTRRNFRGISKSPLSLR
jgi:hypothetical protein